MEKDTIAPMTTSRPREPVETEPTVEALAVVLHDLAWLLPRTVDVDEASGRDTLPPSELEVMRLLVRRPGLTVGEVARELGLQRTNASAAVRTLTGRGLLERHGDPSDGRVARLTPTRRAIENRDRREAAWGQALSRRLDELEPGAAAQVIACAGPLRVLADRLTAGDRPD
jgi:DNA-binding MarR family transcriptional regulator